MPPEDGHPPIQRRPGKVHELRGVEFAWKGTDAEPALDARRGAGVVAQEVEDVAPELVETRADGSSGVDLSGVVGTLIEAFKELAAENGALRRRIEVLGAGRPPDGRVAGSWSRC